MNVMESQPYQCVTKGQYSSKTIPFNIGPLSALVEQLIDASFGAKGTTRSHV